MSEPTSKGVERGVWARGLGKRFKTGRTQAVVLRDVDFEARPGEVTMVMGPSGSGKSTLIAALSGLLKPDSGQVVALGDDLWSQSKSRIDKFRLAHCGFIFQGFNLFPALTALEQVASVLRFQGQGAKRARQTAVEALAEMGLESKLSQRPSELSGGEKQRVAIARALAKRPDLVFADEPTSALDGESGQLVVRLLRRAATDHGAAVVCVTHDPRLERYADRLVRLEDGRILSDRDLDRSRPEPTLAPVH